MIEVASVGFEFGCAESGKNECGLKKLLVVDDEREIVELISIVLDRDDLWLLEAYNGYQALQMARTHHPDVILSDVLMPGLDGLDLCRCIKSNPSTSNAVVILMSARRQLADYSDCQADEFIRKPFEIDYVREVVDRFLSTVA